MFHTQNQLTQIAQESSLTFHHIGVATKSIESEMPFFNALGFVYEAEFSDERQGVRGVFLTPKSHSNTPLPICRFELLENLPNSTRLDNYLKNHHKLYHIAFASENLQADVDFILNSTFSVDSAFKHSNGGGGKMKNDVILDSTQNTSNTNSTAKVSLGNFVGYEALFARSYLSSNAQAKKANPRKSAKEMTQSVKARLVVPIMESSFFSKLCFIMLPNRLLLELVELKPSQQME